MISRLHPIRPDTDELEARILLAGEPFTATPLLADGAGQTLLDSLLASNSNISVVPNSLVYRGADFQAATFANLDLQDAASGVSLQLPNGILLTNGDARLAEHNDGTAEGDTTATGSDADLSGLINGEATNDVNSIEFNFTVPANMKSIQLQLVFGSEEFPEFVGSFNDVLGVFLDGKQIAFDAAGKPLTVNNNFFTLNNNNQDSGEDSEGDTDAAGKTVVHLNDIEYDGLTRPLTTQAPLDPAVSVHHIKIAIADAKDSSLDSAALLANLRASTSTVAVAETSDDTGASSGDGSGDSDSGGLDDQTIQDISVAATLAQAAAAQATPAPSTLVTPSSPVVPPAGPPFIVQQTVSPVTNASTQLGNGAFQALGSGGDVKTPAPPTPETLAWPETLRRQDAADAALATFVAAPQQQLASDEPVEAVLGNLADAEEPRLLALEFGDDVIKRPTGAVKEVAAVLPAPPARRSVAVQQVEPIDGWSNWWWLVPAVPGGAFLGKLAWDHRPHRGHVARVHFPLSRRK